MNLNDFNSSHTERFKKVTKILKDTFKLNINANASIAEATRSAQAARAALNEYRKDFVKLDQPEYVKVMLIAEANELLVKLLKDQNMSLTVTEQRILKSLKQSVVKAAKSPNADLATVLIAAFESLDKSKVSVNKKMIKESLVQEVADYKRYHGDVHDDPFKLSPDQKKKVDDYLKGSKLGTVDAPSVHDKDTGRVAYMDKNIVKKPEAKYSGKASFSIDDAPHKGKLFNSVAEQVKMVESNPSSILSMEDSDPLVQLAALKKDKTLASRIKNLHPKLKEKFCESIVVKEDDIQQAEVVVAINGFADGVGDMIEKMGRMMNEDLMAVKDQTRQVYGADIAEDMHHELSAVFDRVIVTLKGAKDKISSVVNNVSSGQMPSDTDASEMPIDGEVPDMPADAEEVVPEPEIDVPAPRELK